MIKILLFLIVLLPVISFSQPVWIEQTAPGNVPPLISVNAYSSNIVWISGENGTVLVTTDGGLNWVYKDPPQGLGIYPITGIWATGPTTALCLINTDNFAGL